MGDATGGPVRLSFNPQLCVEVPGAKVTSDAGLLLPRELDERLGLSPLIDRHISTPSCSSRWPMRRRSYWSGNGTTMRSGRTALWGRFPLGSSWPRGSSPGPHEAKSLTSKRSRFRGQVLAHRPSSWGHPPSCQHQAIPSDSCCPCIILSLLWCRVSALAVRRAGRVSLRIAFLPLLLRLPGDIGLVSVRNHDATSYSETDVRDRARGGRGKLRSSLQSRRRRVRA